MTKQEFIEAWWKTASDQERAEFLEEVVKRMGMDAFYELLCDTYGEDELRAGIARLSAH